MKAAQRAGRLFYADHFAMADAGLAVLYISVLDCRTGTLRAIGNKSIRIPDPLRGARLLDARRSTRYRHRKGKLRYDRAIFMQGAGADGDVARRHQLRQSRACNPRPVKRRAAWRRGGSGAGACPAVGPTDTAC